MRANLVFILLLIGAQVLAQPSAVGDSARKNYLAELKVTGKSFSAEFYTNYAAVYSLPEPSFIEKIDSARERFSAVLKKYSDQLEPVFVSGQETEIKYYFDKLLIDYPVNHANYLGLPAESQSTIPRRLQANLSDFNKKELLSNTDFINYVKAFFSYQVDMELRKSYYKSIDNRQLQAIWRVIPKFISDSTCLVFWQSDYLYNHIDNNGIKNIEQVYTDFKKTCKDTAALNRVHILYAEDSLGRQDHLIKTYKTVGRFKLDMHLFLPGQNVKSGKRPVVVFFHGGSWSEGKPDWFFYACQEYAKKGWVACAVEYRISGRHGTLPFEAVMDARSAMRWLRQHAQEYDIDTSRIVASGNSAGGHLALCTALADRWNEKTDKLKINPAPNALLINAGVYDLTDQNTAWIRRRLTDKNLVRQISPLFLVRKKFPPALIIHGTNDGNVAYASAEKFVMGMTAAGNSSIEFQPLQGAGHFIWYDPKYSTEVSKLRTGFLTKVGY